MARKWTRWIVLVLVLAACTEAGEDTTTVPSEEPTSTASQPATSTSTVPDEEPSQSAVGEALLDEGAEVNLYWPANQNFANFIDEVLVPGFTAHVHDTYGVDVVVNVLDAAGGDGAFLDRLTANAGRDGFQMDVVRTAPSAAVLDAMEAGLLESLSADSDLIPHLSDLDPAGTAVFELDGDVYGAPIYRPTMSLFYNAALVEDPPTSLEELLSYAAANPGAVTYEDPRSTTGTGSGTMFLLAVMNAFGDPLDEATWGSGWEYLNELQQYVAPQPQAGDQLIDLFARGEILIAPYWNDAGLFAKEDLRIDDMANLLLDEGFPIRFTPFVVPVGASHPVGAGLLVDYTLSPEIQIAFAQRMRQIPSSVASEVTDVIEDDAFGFPMERIAATAFPAYNSKSALDAVAELNNQFGIEVLDR